MSAERVGRRVLVAFDKFKGTATATSLNAAAGVAARELGWDVASVPLSDGGDGLLEVLGGPDRHSTVTGPLGAPVLAAWRLDAGDAVIESALASGLVLAGGAAGNDPMTATSRGTGELVDAAASAGAARIMVGLGGSAGTDGGIGAVEALSAATLAEIAAGHVQLTVCCDVTTRYADAAAVFAPQKGASAQQVEELTERLVTTRHALLERFGVDVGALDGAGAAGGLAGGLAAVGGRLRPGFDLVAERVGFERLVAGADLVLTGEGRLDRASFEGKVVGGVVRLAAAAGVAVVAIVGELELGPDRPCEVVSLVERYGRERAMGDVLGCVEDAARAVLATG